MENTGLSASDIALLSDKSGMNDEGGWFWILALFFLFSMGGNGFGFGNNAQSLTDAIISTNGGYATQQSVNDNRFLGDSVKQIINCRSESISDPSDLVMRD